jgi:hypothetical protein
MLEAAGNIFADLGAQASCLLTFNRAQCEVSRQDA